MTDWQDCDLCDSPYEHDLHTRIEQLNLRIKSLNELLLKKDNQLSLALNALEIYGRGNGDVKQWCNYIDENGKEECVSTKWFHSVVSGKFAMETIEQVRSMK